METEGGLLCARCGEGLGPGDANVKDGLLVEETPVPERWLDTADHPGSARFVLRNFHCPGCATRIDSELNLGANPPRWSTQLLPAELGAPYRPDGPPR